MTTIEQKAGILGASDAREGLRQRERELVLERIGAGAITPAAEAAVLAAYEAGYLNGAQRSVAFEQAARNHGLADVPCDREEPHGEVGRILKDWAGERGITIRFRR